MSSGNSRLRVRKNWCGQTTGPYQFDYWWLTKQYGCGSPAVKAEVRRARRRAAKRTTKKGGA